MCVNDRAAESSGARDAGLPTGAALRQRGRPALRPRLSHHVHDHVQVHEAEREWPGR